MHLRGTIVLLFICAFAKAEPEPFYVSFIKGNVLRSGIPLKAGDILDVNDSQALQFGSMEDIVVVVSPKKGRFTIKAKIVQQAENRLWVLVKDNLIPCTQENPLTTRSTKNLSDLREFLRDGRIAIVDSILMPIEKSAWEDLPTNFFYIKYDYRDQKIEKKLELREPVKKSDPVSVLLDTGVFYVGNVKISSSDLTNTTLNFYQQDILRGIKIKDLKLIYMLDEPTRTEIKIVFDAMAEYLNHDEALIQKDLMSHIQEFYGNIDGASTSRLLVLLNGKP